MTDPETLFPSPLTPEECAQFERVARSLAANPSGLDGYGGWAIGFLRALALADSMAARVSDLEAANETLQGWSQGVESRAEVLKVERDGAVERARLCLEAKDWWMERALRAAIEVAADLTELRARSARLERERDEERAARLKAEAERDTWEATRWASFEDWKAEKARADSALALLSKAREAFARWRAFQATFRADGKPPELKGPVADLAKILGTGE